MLCFNYTVGFHVPTPVPMQWLPRRPRGQLLTLRANPYSKGTDHVCRLPWPTLFYKPKVFNLGDLLRFKVRMEQTRYISCYFKGGCKILYRKLKSVSVPPMNLLSGQTNSKVFQGSRIQKHPWELPHPRQLKLCCHTLCSNELILKLFPFSLGDKSPLDDH